jgi:8-oxo-dGTP diphosphatase
LIHLPFNITGVDLVYTDVSQVMEPHKCSKWEWVPWTQMWLWAREEAEAREKGEEVKRKMFLPLVNLYRQYPELENCLEGR